MSGSSAVDRDASGTVAQEVPDCIVCGSGQRHPHLRAPNRFNVGEVFPLVQCSQCGFVYLSPRPSQESIGSHYEDEGYHPHQAEAAGVVDRIYRISRDWNLRYKRWMVESHHRKGALLDFGCGTGEFLAEMRANGWQVTGVEPAAQARAVAEGLGVRASADLEGCDGPYDVITLWHVLEHVHEAAGQFRRLCELLTPGGILVMALPNIGSVDSRAYGANWVALDAPRHLFHFRPQDVRRFAVARGLTPAGGGVLPLDTPYNVLLSEQLAGQVVRGTRLFGLFRAIRVALAASIRGAIDRSRSSSPVYVFRS
jgi:SAM-dependent methyltransferase